MSDRTCAPIVLFVYNRLGHTQRTVEALQKNHLATESDLIVYADGAKRSEDEEKVSAVRNYVHAIVGFRSVEVRESSVNKGLANSIIAGVTAVIGVHGRAIIIEDDLVTSPFFLTFMNDGLDMYADDPRVSCVHGFVYPVREKIDRPFFLRGADCWGWATWKRAWECFEQDGEKLYRELVARKLTDAFDYDGVFPSMEVLRDQVAKKVDSWAIRWAASAFLKEMFVLYPNENLVHNIGIDGSGTHCTPADPEVLPLATNRIILRKEKVGVRSKIVRMLKRRYSISVYPKWVSAVACFVRNSIGRMRRKES